MEDEKRSQLVRRHGSEAAREGRQTNRVIKGMTQDVLALAKAKDLSAAKFRIGDYLLREPDYRQILHWAEVGEMKPETVLQRISECVVEPFNLDKPVIDPISFSIEDGAMLSVAWDFERLPFIPDKWEPGLLISELGFKGTWPNVATALKPHLPMLKTLVCNSIRLEVLTLSHLAELNRLYCGFNNLSELDLTPVPELTELDCGFNELGKLDLLPVARMTKLFCWFNNLSELDLMPVPELIELDCHENNLTKLDLTPVPGLTELDCGFNSLSELDFTQLSKLIKLHCDGNNLTELDLMQLPRVADLTCDIELRLRNTRPGLKIEYL